MTVTRRGESKAFAWLAGLVVGAATGFLLAEWPAAGLLIGVGFTVVAIASPRRVAAVGGLLVGIPAAWLLVVGLATARCADFGAQPGSECVMANLGGWGVVAAAILALGLVASVFAARR